MRLAMLMILLLQIGLFAFSIYELCTYTDGVVVTLALFTMLVSGFGIGSALVNLLEE